MSAFLAMTSTQLSIEVVPDVARAVLEPSKSYSMRCWDAESASLEAGVTSIFTLSQWLFGFSTNVKDSSALFNITPPIYYSSFHFLFRYPLYTQG